jgi:hypothetical protein
MRARSTKQRWNRSGCFTTGTGTHLSMLDRAVPAGLLATNQSTGDRSD